MGSEKGRLGLRRLFPGGRRLDGLNHEVDELRAENERLALEVDELGAENLRLLEMILIDPATGLPNAAAFDADHLQLWARRRRTEERYSVLLVDVDEPGSYNQRAGWSAGHEVLSHVGQKVSDCVRQGDRAYRYGDDEFTVLLTGASVTHAVAAGEVIRAAVERPAAPGPEGGGDTGPAALTVSVAVVEAGFRHDGPKDVMSELDQLVAKAKRAGPNRVIWPH